MDQIEDLKDRINKTVAWAKARLKDCNKTIAGRTRPHCDWAYGESVALKAMIDILEGKVDPP